MIETARLRLRPWRADHLPAFAAMQADPEVMHDQGVADEAACVAKVARYRAAFETHGFTRWAVEDVAGTFVGYAGIVPGRLTQPPLGPHFEIGWRLVRRFWGQGYASEAARGALDDLWRSHPGREVLAYTSPQNLRSQAVMARLGFRRDPARDFELCAEAGGYRGWVWVAV